MVNQTLVDLICQERAAFAAAEIMVQEPLHLRALQRLYWHRDHAEVFDEVFKKVVYKRLAESQQMGFGSTIGREIPFGFGVKPTEEVIGRYEALLQTADSEQKDYFLYFGRKALEQVLLSAAADPIFWYQDNVYLISARAEAYFEQPLLQRGVDCLRQYSQQMIQRIKEVKGWTQTSRQQEELP